MIQMTNIVCIHLSVLIEVKDSSSYIVIVMDLEWGPHIINNATADDSVQTFSPVFSV